MPSLPPDPPSDEAQQVAEDAAKERERILAFDQQVRELQLSLMAEFNEQDISWVLVSLSAALGNAQAAHMNGEHKASRAFLTRVAALIRYVVTQRDEMKSEEASDED
jgi:hypothetical protein